LFSTFVLNPNDSLGLFFLDHPIKWELSGNEYNHQMGAIDTIEFSDHSVSTAVTRYGEQKLLLGEY
jgi:hypothetical protein